jgi:hypothetical protein
MPPAIVRGFSMDTNFEGDREIPGLETNVGPITLDDDLRSKATPFSCAINGIPNSTALWRAWLTLIISEFGIIDCLGSGEGPLSRVCSRLAVSGH